MDLKEGGGVRGWSEGMFSWIKIWTNGEWLLRARNCTVFHGVILCSIHASFGEHIVLLAKIYRHLTVGTILLTLYQQRILFSVQ